jgi:hypothetical protein
MAYLEVLFQQHSRKEKPVRIPGARPRFKSDTSHIQVECYCTNLLGPVMGFHGDGDELLVSQ